MGDLPKFTGSGQGQVWAAPPEPRSSPLGPESAFLPCLCLLRRLTLNSLWGYLEERGDHYNTSNPSNVAGHTW